MKSSQEADVRSSAIQQTIATTISITNQSSHSALPGIGSRAPVGQFGPGEYERSSVMAESSARGAEILRAAVANRALHLAGVESLLDQPLAQLAFRGEAQEEPDER